MPTTRKPLSHCHPVGGGLVRLVLLSIIGTGCGRLGYEPIAETDAGSPGITEQATDAATSPDASGATPDVASQASDTASQAPDTDGEAPDDAISLPPCSDPLAVVEVQGARHCGNCNGIPPAGSPSVVLPAGRYRLTPMSGAISVAHGSDGTWAWRLCTEIQPDRAKELFEINSQPTAADALNAAANVLVEVTVAQEPATAKFWFRDSLCSDNLGSVRLAICPLHP